MSRKQPTEPRKAPEPVPPASEPPADFDETMKRLMGIPPDRAKEIVKKTAPGKPKAERERKPKRHPRTK